MSIITSFSPVETNMTGKEFSVSSNTSHLFAMLSDILYSNKELAVINEICANAIDVHSFSGIKDTPIRVICPTMLSPTLIIRDFGSGLSDNDVRLLLTTYGESGQHKRTSNEYYGCWGVGSKSPAAVTENWKIVSHFLGV